MKQRRMFEREGSRERVYRLPVVRVVLVRERSVPFGARQISSSAEAARLVRELVGDADREHLVALYLDVKNRVVAVHTVSIGGLNLAVVHLREVYKAALLANAAGVLLAHNHPSGDPAPSREDVEATRRVAAAGEILGIHLLDHVVVGDGRFVSMKEEGLV